MRRTHVIAATAAIVVLSPAVTWWLVGDLSERGVSLDYLLRPPDLTRLQQQLIGGTAAVLCVAAIVVVVLGVRRGLVERGELAIAVPLLLAGVFCGFAERVITAGVGGANIGGGIMLLFGPIFLLAMLAWTAMWWRRAR